MDKYRIDIYTGPRFCDGIISQEYKRFKCVDDAKIYAYQKAIELNAEYSLQQIQ